MCFPCSVFIKTHFMKTGSWILCETIRQGKFPASLYDRTVNTIRMITFRNVESEEFEVFFAVQRIGTKATIPVDKGLYKNAVPGGMKPYLGVTWFHDVFYDLFFDHSVSFPDKLWGYKHGFFSYRLPQYGITKENHLSYISDFEYKWMRHINSRYRTWLENKITVKYIASDYKECFPEYYYYTVWKNNLNKIIAMMDLPEDYGTEAEDIFRLVKEKGDLALKMVSGSHGDGFYRFSYKDGEYLLNGNPTSEEEIEGIIMNPDSQYLITEFIKSHPELSKYYDGAVSTLRFIVFKKDGRTPQMADCYMRVGTSATGAVDNIGAGGMFAKVDMKDGHYSDAALMVNNNIIPTPHHPDSGLLVDGYIPIMQMAGMLPVYSFS